MEWNFYNNAGELKVTTLADVGGGGSGATVETGVVSDFAGSVAPSGYFLCDGASKDTTTEAALFAVIGYSYGGAGSSFNIPDTRGRAAVGKGTHADVNALNDNDGEGTVANRTPKHSHTVNSHSHTIAHTHAYNHTHGTNNNGSIHTHSVNGNTNNGTISTNTPSGSGSTRPTVGHFHAVNIQSGNANAQHNHTTNSQSSITTGPASNGSSGSAAPATNIQGPDYIVFNKIIKY